MHSSSALIHSHYGAISHEKVHFSWNKELQLKNNLLPFPATLHRKYVFFIIRWLCVKKTEWKIFGWKICSSFIEWEKINFLPHNAILMLCNFYPFSDTLDSDLIRWKKCWKFSRKTSTPILLSRKVIFHRALFFSVWRAKMNTEHLTNCDRIQWQLTQFVNQFPLHALNIFALNGESAKME